MLDYQANCAALSDFVVALSGQLFPDAELTSAKTRSLAAVGANGSSAMLGAVAYHLIGHAASDGSELALLQRASDLWQQGLALCSQLGSIRSNLESALTSPQVAGAAANYNSATVSAQLLANQANELRVSVEQLRLDALTFKHLPVHPRQRDLVTRVWDWGNLILGRRTDAFVRSLLQSASSANEIAFATGVLSAYGANVAGSAYLGHSVGGPRRTHRFRDRLARNAIGGWISANHPGANSSTALSVLLGFGSPAPSLPSELKNLLDTAIRQSFDTAKTEPIPDLDLGYTRLMSHLSLLDGFILPSQPTLPPAAVITAVLSAPR